MSGAVALDSVAAPRPPGPAPRRSLRSDLHVHVLLPYRHDEHGVLVSCGYETPEFNAEMTEWFGPLGLRWTTHAATIAGVDAIVARLAADRRPVVVVNLCDGDETDGYPGLTAVEALEAAGLPFTGASSRFYRVSTSKLAMKRRFVAHGVPTAPFVPLARAGDAGRVAAEVGFPAIVKLDISCDGLGLDRTAVVTDEAGLTARWRDLAEAGLLDRKPYAERFVAGREFTVLVVADRRAPGGLATLPAVEMVYEPAVPPNERILFRGHRDTTVDGRPWMPGEPHRCRYETAPPDVSAAAATIARSAFRAVGGTGYGRVDMRMAGDGDIRVLEVNANCSLSLTEKSITPALASLGRPFSSLVGDILAAALARAPARLPVPA